MSREHVLKLLEKGIRLDGRKLTEFRDIKIDYNISSGAEGSARVKVGDTEVLAGVKMSVETPYPDTPDQGSLMVNAELLPLSSPDFEPGPPGIMAVELARVVDRGIRESHAIDVKKLCIKSGEKAWVVMIDICTINSAGSLIDTSAIAALAALKVAKFPKYEDDKIDYSVKTDVSVPIAKEPMTITVYKIGKYLLVDPLDEEEKAADARLTITTEKDGSLCSLQKGGATTLTIDEIGQMIDIAAEKSKEIRKKF
jgi:exosome complex component RRP42